MWVRVLWDWAEWGGILVVSHWMIAVHGALRWEWIVENDVCWHVNFHPFRCYRTNSYRCKKYQCVHEHEWVFSKLFCLSSEGLLATFAVDQARFGRSRLFRACACVSFAILFCCRVKFVVSKQSASDPSYRDSVTFWNDNAKGNHCWEIRHNSRSMQAMCTVTNRLYGHLQSRNGRRRCIFMAKAKHATATWL